MYLSNSSNLPLICFVYILLEESVSPTMKQGSFITCNMINMSKLLTRTLRNVRLWSLGFDVCMMYGLRMPEKVSEEIP